MTKGRAAPTSTRGPVERGRKKVHLHSSLLLSRTGAHLCVCVAGGAERWAAFLVQSACLLRRAETLEGWLKGGQRH